MQYKTLKFDEVEIDSKKFRTSKQTIGLNSVNTNKIVIFAKVEHGDKIFKFYWE